MVDLDQFKKENVKLTPAAIEVVLIDRKMVKAKDVYKDKTDQPEADMIQLTFENAQHGVKFTNSYMFYPLEGLNDNSKQGRFIVKYGSLDIGLTGIMAIKNSKNFYEVVL